MGYIGMYRCEGYGFLWDRIYKSESLGRKGYGSIAHEAKPNGLLTRGP